MVPIMPITSRIRNSPEPFTIIWDTLLKTFKNLLQLSLLFGGIGLLWYSLGPNFEFVISCALISCAVLVGLLTLSELLTFTRYFFQDVSLIRGICLTGPQSRSTIHKHFTSFKTAFWRLRFMKRIEEQKIEPHGEWPAGYAPNVEYDAASTLLAQLDERWTMLDC